MPPVGGPEGLRGRRRRLLGPSLRLSYRDPLTIVRGQGAYLYDEEGRAYLDGVNNVAHVGHAHPKVVEAAARQMAELNTNTRYLHPAILEYAERLRATMPAPLEVCYFVNSGSEANELALRLAAAHTGGEGIIVVEAAYHGNTTGCIQISPYKFNGPGGGGRPPHVQVVDLPDPYRGRWRREDPSAGARYAAQIGEAASRIREDGGRPAAFFAEPLPGCGGQIVPPAGWLPGAFEEARSAGAITVCDEVQVGFGRVGTAFWAFQDQGALPDIVTMGKPIGNGHPLGAVVTTRAIARAFDNGMEYFNTFGGNPVSCAVGMAVLDVIEEEGLQEHARTVGGRLLAGLAEVGERHSAVGDVRGRGLYLGIEMVSDSEARTPHAEVAADVVEGMKAEGILLSTDGPDRNVIKIKPPLVFSEEDALRLIETLDTVLGGMGTAG